MSSRTVFKQTSLICHDIPYHTISLTREFTCTHSSIYIRPCNISFLPYPLHPPPPHPPNPPLHLHIHLYLHISFTKSAPFSAIAYTAICGCPPMSCGMILASTTRRLVIPPRTCRVGVTTLSVSSSSLEEVEEVEVEEEDILQVPDGW